MENKAFEDDRGVTDSATTAAVSQGQVQLSDLDTSRHETAHGEKGDRETSIEKPKESEKESKTLFLPISLNDKDVGATTNGDGGHAVSNRYSINKNADDDADVDIVCGVGSFTPKFLQGCMSIGYFASFYSISGLVTSALNVYISSQITTLEKYYNFSSSVSGFLMSCNDIGYLLTALLMSYYSRRVHIPRGLGLATFVFGLSGILCALAYAVTKDEHASLTNFKLHNANSDNATSGRHKSFDQLCLNVTPASNTTNGEDVVAADRREMSAFVKYLALSILVLGMAIQGMAKSPRHSFLGTFVDDNVPKTESAKYLGVMSGMGIFGPAVAYVIGGFFSRVYVSLEDPGISVRDPRWVGAWWLGFLVFGGAAVVASLPIACFPRHLKGRRQIEEVEAQKKGVAEDEKKATVKVAQDFKGFLKSLARLLRNPVYSLMMLAISLNMMGVGGYYTFAAKYLETQFTVPVFKANVMLGGVNVLSAATGSILGGFLVSRLKMTPKACLWFGQACLILSYLIFGLTFVLGCDQPDILTATDEFSGSGGGISRFECAVDCNCDTQNFFPVCGADNRNYFSPCHAGCTDVAESNVFVNCSCAVLTNATATTSNRSATAGLCTPDCNNFYPYIATMFFHALIACLSIMPHFVTYVRAVAEKDKPLALGLFAFSATVIGWLPGPMVFGYLVDTCCEIWSSQGACVLYNLPTFRFRFHFLVLVLRIFTTLIIFVVILIVTFSKTFEFQSHRDDEEVDIVCDTGSDESIKLSTFELNRKGKELEANGKR